MVIKVKNTKQKKQENKKMKNIKSSVSKQYSTNNLAAVFDKHVNYEFEDKVVDELIMSFTHDIEIPAMIPGIPPTGKYVELPLVVVMKFKENKIAHEHIYWDQASLLKQIGLLDNNSIPVIGIEQSKKLQELLSLSTQKKTQKKKSYVNCC